jgi:hypothetical protein
MVYYLVGTILIFVGIGLLIVSRSRSTHSTVRASKGSIAVGGANTGQITNLNNNAQEGGGHGLTVVAIIVEVIGIAVVIWHALHLASR